MFFFEPEVSPIAQFPLDNALLQRRQLAPTTHNLLSIISVVEAFFTSSKSRNSYNFSLPRRKFNLEEQSG